MGSVCRLLGADVLTLDAVFVQFNATFPADFIGEGLDQTRGWFYTLLVLSTSIFGRAPFKNLVVNGMSAFLQTWKRYA